MPQRRHPRTDRLVIDKWSGNVGIGTNDPVGVNGGLRLEGSSSTGFEYIATNNSQMADGEFTGAYLFKNVDTGGTTPHYAGMSAKTTGTGGKMILHFHTNRDKYETDALAAMIIDHNNDVGFGTASPNGMLSIYTGSTSKSGFSIDRYPTGNYRTEFYQGE